MSKIEWTEKTWNPITGCDHISPGCENCYAEKMTKRLKAMGQEKYCNGFDVTCHPDVLAEPLKRQKPTVYFVNSMSDTFHKNVTDDFIGEIYNVMYECSQHIFLVLTKRADRMADFVKMYGLNTMVNIYHGVTVCNQQEADEKIPHLLKVPGKRFLSIEPMLGAISLAGIDAGVYRSWLDTKAWVCGIHQVLLGGESGKNARPIHPDWVRGVRDQCSTAGVPFMFKQWGEFSPIFDGTKLAFTPVSSGAGMDEKYLMYRVGKKKAGRMLDGKLHDELIWNQGAP